MCLISESRNSKISIVESSGIKTLDHVAWSDKVSWNFYNSTTTVTVFDKNYFDVPVSAIIVFSTCITEKNKIIIKRGLLWWSIDIRLQITYTIL